MKTGITLSGGGIRGFAHIGVLKALEENGIFPEIICGVSAGSIVGTLYAAGYSAKELEEIGFSENFHRIFGFEWFRMGLTNNIHIRKILEKHIQEDSFSVLKRSLTICATNLNTGRLEEFRSGQLFDVVRASCSVPVIFSPVEIQGNLYMDGGVMDNMPILPVRDKCDFLIAVNIVPFTDLPTQGFTSIAALTSRIFELNLWSKVRPNVRLCDVIVEPYGIENFGFFDFRKKKELIQLGYDVTMEMMDSILNKLEEKKS